MMGNDVVQLDGADFLASYIEVSSNVHDACMQLIYPCL